MKKKKKKEGKKWKDIREEDNDDRESEVLK